MDDECQLAANLAAFADEVRASTLRRFARIEAADWGWSARPDLLTFADVLKHLVDADRWLFARLEGAEPSHGVVILPGAANPEDSIRLLAEFRELGRERRRRISELTDHDFNSRRFDLLSRGYVTLFQLIARCNLDHEIHHRGS